MGAVYAITILLLGIAGFATGSQASPSALEAERYHIPNISPVSQLPDLPNGCEAVAAAMLLNWAGVDVTKEEVAGKLPLGSLPSVNDDGAMIGGNPQREFVGDPFSVGYGIFHKPVADVLDSYLPGEITDVTGSTFDDLLDIIKSGRPAMVWATERMAAPHLTAEWQDKDGSVIEWYDPEHALLLTGWDDDYAYMDDPMTGQEEKYSLGGFKTVWETMGSQAITVKPKP